MLSPGQYHLEVPRDPIQNVLFRAELLEACKANPKMRPGVLEMCQQDILFFINAFVWQYNPKKKGKDAFGPFITWPFQERALLDRPPKRKGILWYYEHDRTAVVEKSREMGASWLFLILQVWLGISQQFMQAFNISRSADAVDSKSRNSLFSKVRFIHENLPNWLKGPLEEQNFYFNYKRTRSEITGEASTGRAGAGGRASVVFVDEFPEIREDTKVRQNTASITDCRFFNGTHLGTHTEFYDLTQNDAIGKIQFHWTQHPDKNKGLYSYDSATNQIKFWEYDEQTDEIVPRESAHPSLDPDYPYVRTAKPLGGPHPGIRSPWYDRKCKDIGTDRGVAMELDIDPQGSMNQSFNSLIIRELILNHSCSPLWEGDVIYDPDTGIPTHLQERQDGPLRLWRNPSHMGRPPVATYGAGCDLSQGRGATPSCLSLGDLDTKEKVGELVTANLDPKEFAAMVVAICRLFVDEYDEGAKLVWEIPGPGLVFGDKVVELDYRNLWRRTREDLVTKVVTEHIGWVANVKTKNFLLGDYRTALEGRKFLNRSEAALRECLKFRFDAKSGNESSSEEENEKDPSGAKINHGDRVIADALLWMLMKSGEQRSVVAPSKEIPTNSFAGRRLLREARRREEEYA